MIKEKLISKKTLESGKNYELIERVYKTEFGGCQCVKECTCKEDFISEERTLRTLKLANISEVQMEQIIEILKQ